MKEYLLTTLLLVLSTFYLFGQVTIKDDEFLGIEIGKTGFNRADSLLKTYSFKDPKKISRHIHWRDGGASTLFLPHYYIKTEKSKLEIILKGYFSVDQIHIYILKNGKDINYNGLILGQTKVKDIKGLVEQDWEKRPGLEMDSILTTKYGNILIGVDSKPTDSNMDKKIICFILSKD